MADFRIRLSLLWAGLRWRLAPSLVMAAVAVAGVGAGAFGPIYLHGADQSATDGILDAATPANTGLTLAAPAGAASLPALRSVAAAAPRPAGGSPWFGAPIATDVAGFTTDGKGQSYSADLVARTGTCAHLTFVSGSCPIRAGTVALSTRTARELGVTVGGTVVASFVRSTRTAPLVVAGLYRPPDPQADFWWGENFFAYGTGPPRQPALDTAFASATTVARIAPAPVVSHVLQVPFRSGSLSVDQVGELRSALAAYRLDAARDHGVSVGTQIGQLLDQAASVQHTMATIVIVVDVQLVLLALLTLHFVGVRTAGEREPDLRLAELRGYGPWHTFGLAVAEPVAILAAAVPGGVAIAWLVAAVLAPRLFGSGIGATVTGWAVLAAVATAVLGMGTMALVARRLVSADLVAGGTPRGRARTGAVRWAADAAVVAVALAAFVELVLVGVSPSGGTGSDPLAGFAPGLLALAVGVVAARLIPAVLGAAPPFTRRTGWVAGFLAVRRVARRPELAAQVVLVVLAVALATFGLSGWSIAATNRSVRTAFDVGAPRVLTVSVRPGVDLLSAVRAADGAGDTAMAAVVVHAADGTTLAVDSSRLAAVAAWPAGLDPGGAEAAARRLVPAHLAPVVTVAGRALAVTVTTASTLEPRPELTADLFDSGYQSPEQVPFGPLRPGTARYQASLAGLCPSGCRLVDLSIAWNPALGVAPVNGSARLMVTSLDEEAGDGTWTPLHAGLDDAARWSSPDGGARITSSSSGLAVQLSLSPYGSPSTLGPADVPAALPALITPPVAATVGTVGTGLQLVGLDGATLDGRSVGTVAALPRVGGAASLVDLDLAQRLMAGPFSDDTTEVWLAADAPAGIAARLAARGVTVVSTDSAAVAQAATSRGGVGLAYTLFLLAAIVAAALAVGATGFALSVESRRRGPELAALRAVGVGAGALRRSIVAEQSLLLASAVVLGVASGALTAVVALRSLPEFVIATAGPPQSYGLPLVLLVSAAAVLLAALAATVGFGAAAMLRAARVDRLGAARS